jgi:hypothetical protein
MSKIEAKIGVNEIIEQMSKQEEISKLLQKIGIQNVKLIEPIKNYKTKEHRQGVVIKARKNGDAETLSIIIDVKEGQPTTNQVFDALYGIGAESVTKILMFTGAQLKNDRNDPGANDLVVQNFVKNIRRYQVNIHLIRVTSSQDKSLCYEIIETDDHDDEIEYARLPVQEVLRQHEFWDVYYWYSQLNNFMYPWETFEGCLDNGYEEGHMYGLNGLDLYARLDEKGLSFEVRNNGGDNNYLETIWTCKKYDLQVLFPDCEVKYVVQPGKLPRVKINVWNTPMSSICTAPIAEKKRWAKKILNEFGKLNDLMDGSLWDLKEGKLEGAQEFIQLSELS